MTEFDPIARAGEAIGKTVEQLLADNDRLTAENARLNSLINDTANHWLALQIAHPIAWEGAIDEAMRAACDEIARHRAKLELTPENVERVKDGLACAGAWLERWAVHVGNCRGDNLCTCGLTRVRYDATAAIKALSADQ